MLEQRNQMDVWVELLHLDSRAPAGGCPCGGHHGGPCCGRHGSGPELAEA